jgi:hypothetical protein
VAKKLADFTLASMRLSITFFVNQAVPKLVVAAPHSRSHDSFQVSVKVESIVFGW